MKTPRLISRQLLAQLVLVSAIAYPVGVWAQTKSATVISQKNRTYAPGSVTIKAGETLKIINDDIFLHHAFIDDGGMDFDSGSMEEGESSNVTFKNPGEYQVLCAIHPKMKLNVTVK